MLETPPLQILRPRWSSFCFQRFIPRSSCSHFRKGGRVCGVKRYRSEAARGRHCEPSCACSSPRLGSLPEKLLAACVVSECVVELRTSGQVDGRRLVERLLEALDAANCRLVLAPRLDTLTEWTCSGVVESWRETYWLPVLLMFSRLGDIHAASLVTAGRACRAVKLSPSRIFSRRDWLDVVARK